MRSCYTKHDYPCMADNLSKNTNRKKSVKENPNFIKSRILLFHTIIFTTAFRIVQIVAWLAKTIELQILPEASPLSFPFPSCRARSLYLSPQAPYNTKRLLRRREYVAVNSLSQEIFLFLLFLGMAIYANEFETKEVPILTEVKN